MHFLAQEIQMRLFFGVFPTNIWSALTKKLRPTLWMRGDQLKNLWKQFHTPQNSVDPTFEWKSVFVDWQKWTTRRWIENWNLRNPSSLQRLNSGGCEGYHWWLKQNWQRWNFLMFFRTKKLSIICLSLNGHPSRGSCRNAVDTKQQQLFTTKVFRVALLLPMGN